MTELLILNDRIIKIKYNHQSKIVETYLQPHIYSQIEASNKASYLIKSNNNENKYEMNIFTVSR